MYPCFRVYLVPAADRFHHLSRDQLGEPSRSLVAPRYHDSMFPCFMNIHRGEHAPGESFPLVASAKFGRVIMRATVVRDCRDR